MEGGDMDDMVMQLREGLDAGTNALLDDFDCMRFLRARQLNVAKAVDMARQWGSWATEALPGSPEGKCPLNLLDTVEDPNEDLYTRYCPHLMEGEDRDGRPVYWEQTGEGSCNFSKLKQEINHDEMLARHIRLQLLMQCRLKHCSERHGKHIGKLVSVQNFGGISMQPDLDSIKYAIAVLGCDQSYFPETLHTVYAINCPWYITALYSLVSPFIDQVTKSKIRLLGSDYYSTLVEAIDEDQIPVEYGGKKVYRWSWPWSEASGCSPDQIRRYRYSGGDPAPLAGELARDEVSHVGDLHDKLNDISP